MLNFKEMPVGTIYYCVSEEEWSAAGADENGDVYGDRDFRPIADCATLADAQQAAVQAVGVQGRIYIDKMTKGPNGSGGGPVFAGYRSDLQAGLRIPVQSAVSSNTGARQVG
jgi:hypothetical protein